MASATEPREHSTSAGVAYEVILSPKVETARKPRLTPLRGKENKKQLDERMKAAEERRKSIEGEMLAKVVVQIARVNQVQLNKQQTEEKQSKIAEEKCKQNMESHIEKKEAQIQALIDRLHAKDNHIREVQAKLREISVSHAKKLEEKIQHKEAVTKEKLELLRKVQTEQWQAHEKRIQEVLASLQEIIEKNSKKAEENLQERMEKTEEKRQAQIRALQERLRLKSSKIEQARQFMDKLVEETKKSYEEKLKQRQEQMEEKRNAELRKIQQKAEAHDKHVEEVCQKVKTRKAENTQ